ncbi:MAG: ATP-binding protein [Acidobacteriota bacterium]
MAEGTLTGRGANPERESGGSGDLPGPATPPPHAEPPLPGAPLSDQELKTLADERPLSLVKFHDELRARNLAHLRWTAIVFNILYLGWSAFDYILAPQHWRFFLLLRIVAVALNSATVALVHSARFRRYTFEAFWVVAVVFGGFIAPMLPLVGDSTSAYMMGLAVVIFGAGLLPLWPPRWGASSIGAILACASVGLLLSHPSAQFSVYLGSSFFVLTAAGVGVVACYFKYDLVRREFYSRAEITAVARREADARERLARATSDLQDALDQLKELDRLKSKFFANVSHELRTPLTLILAPVEELLQGTGDPGRRRYLEVIRKNAHRLLRMIDDLLDLSRLDAGGLRLNVAEVDMRAIAAAVHENSQPAALTKSISFAFKAEPSPRRIVGDAHRLEIVLTNLVSNAIKFTPEGGKIELRIDEEESGVRVTVADTGEGIPADALPRVFERFFQVGGQDRRREGGVGIGLALAKELVELHGGTITVTSNVGEGSTFTVFLPFGRQHLRPEVIERRRAAVHLAPLRRADDLQTESPQPRRGETSTDSGDQMAAVTTRRARILLAEDNPEVRGFIRTLLEREFDLLLAADGDQAWEILQREVPDLVVSDIMMPGRSGTDLCREIKADPKLRAIPVILLTARVGSEATLEGYAHGADDFVAKPFHPRVLLARVRAQLKLRELALRLVEQEKLAVVGTLAAGILHEVRNPLNAILNATRVLAEGKSDAAMASRLFAIIIDGADRIRGITAALETHARPSEAGGTGPSDVRAGIDATLLLLEHRMAGIEVHREYETDLPAVAPPGPLNQVVLNLIDNAIRSGARTLWLRVTSRADRLTIRVSDDGPGVPGEIARRIFDPFFSTREPGAGTGLGLYLSRRIIESHDGSLWYEDRPGGGATFVVDLPAFGASGRHGDAGPGH